MLKWEFLNEFCFMSKINIFILIFRFIFGFGFEFEFWYWGRKRERPQLSCEGWEGRSLSDKEEQVAKVSGSNSRLPQTDENYQWQSSVETPTREGTKSPLHKVQPQQREACLIHVTLHDSVSADKCNYMQCCLVVHTSSNLVGFPSFVQW